MNTPFRRDVLLLPYLEHPITQEQTPKNLSIVEKMCKPVEIGFVSKWKYFALLIKSVF